MVVASSNSNSRLFLPDSHVCSGLAQFSSVGLELGFEVTLSAVDGATLGIVDGLVLGDELILGVVEGAELGIVLVLGVDDGVVLGS